MEILPGFGTNQTAGKVCKIKKSLYGLKQSPRGWFDRFRKAIVGMRYQQINADHIVFYRQYKGHTMILAMYVDHMIITSDDDGEIAHLKAKLDK
jgi:Reverse transcriptase (RNA-dependent DNA polymerase)